MLKNILKLNYLLILALTVSLLNGCAILALGAVGTAAGTTAVVASDPRTSGTVVNDNTIAVKLRSKYSQYEHSNIYVTAYDGNVLLTGQIANRTQQEKAVFNARVMPGVKHIYNYLEVRLPQSFIASSQDGFITTKIRTKLFNVRSDGINISSIKVVTTDKVVYLLGVVTYRQAQTVSKLVANVDGVRKVVTLFEYVN